MSGTIVKGIKRTSSLSSSRRVATTAAKSRTSAGKPSRPKPLVKKKAEKSPARKATKGKVATSSTKSKKASVKSSVVIKKVSSKPGKSVKSSKLKTVSPKKASKKAVKKVEVTKKVNKKVVAKPKVTTKPVKKTAVKAVKKPAKVAPKAKKAVTTKVKQKSSPKSVKAKANRSVKKTGTKKSAPKIILPPPKKTPPPPPTPRQPSPNEAAALKVFEKAHKEFVRGHFTEARNQFRELLEKHSGVVEVAARARTYLAIAESRMKTETSPPKDADSLYDRGVVELNRGEYVTAQEFFERALKFQPNAAHIHYGLAATKAQLGEIEESLKFLEHSFTLDPVLRFRSTQDQDLAPLHSIPEFEQLVAS